MKQDRTDHIAIHGGAFFINGPEVHIVPFNRGATQGISAAFTKGFSSHSSAPNPNLMSHLFQGFDAFSFSDRSCFISTSTSKAVATEYAIKRMLSPKQAQAYVYEINPSNRAIDVGKFLKTELEAGRITPKMFDHIAWEKEMAFPYKIEPTDIKGAYPMIYSETGELVRGEYIANPKYIPPLSKTTAGIRMAGAATTIVGATLDASNLWYAFQESQTSGDYQLFFNEGARVIGGWHGAISLGTLCSKLGALWFAPLGPLASLTAGTAFGAAGSIVGYSIGGALSSEIESILSRALHEINFIPNMVVPELSFIGSANVADDAKPFVSQSWSNLSMPTSQPQATDSGNYFINLLKNAGLYMRGINPTPPLAAYDIERITETFAAHMRSAGHSFAAYSTPKNTGLTQWAHYLQSPKNFTENTHIVSQRILAFINSDSADAAAFTKQKWLEFQLAFLDEMQGYSEISIEHAFDRVTELLNKEKIPENARSLYYQQMLSVLPMKEDLTVDQIERAKNHAAVKKQYDTLIASVGDLQKNADRHHREVSSALKKLELATKGNTEAIQELKVGQQELIRFLNDQKIESDRVLKEQQKEKQSQQEIEGYQKFSQFLSMWGDVADEPVLKDAGTACMAGVMTYQAYQGFSTLAATAAAEAAAGVAGSASSITLGSCLGPIAMAGMATLMVISLFSKGKAQPQSDEAHKQIMHALSQIMSRLEVMHKQMHQRFDRLEEQGLRTRELMLLGFDNVFFQLREIAAIHLCAHHAIEGISSKADFIASDLRLAFSLLQRRPAAEVWAVVTRPPAQHYLERLSLEKYTEYLERLNQWLIADSCDPINNGYHRICDDGEVIVRHDVVAKALKNQTPARMNASMGLLAGLANYHDATFFPKPASLLNRAQFELCFEPYRKLVISSKLARDKAAHLHQIQNISERAKSLMTFLERLAGEVKFEISDVPASRIYSNDDLFEKLVAQYHQSLKHIEVLIQKHLHMQEREFYKKRAIQVSPGVHLLKLDETFSEASTRHRAAEFLDACGDVPIIYSGQLAQWEIHPFTFSKDLKKPGYKIHQRTSIGWYEGDIAQAAWENFSRHFKGSEEGTDKPLRHELFQFIKDKSENAQKAALAHAMHYMPIIRRYYTKLPGDELFCMHNGTYGFSIELGFGENKLMLVSGGTASQMAEYYLFFPPGEDRSQEALALHSASFWHVSAPAMWGEPIFVSDQDFNAFISMMSDQIDIETHAYRVEAIRQLNMDVEYQQALVALESSGLQLQAFLNVLQIPPQGYQCKLINAQEMGEALAAVVNAADGPCASIEHLQYVLASLCHPELQKEDIMRLVQSVDISSNELYIWAKSVVTRLEDLKVSVSAWLDAPSQQFTSVSSSQPGYDLETDSSDDEAAFEAATQAQALGLGYNTHDGRFWQKRPGESPGARILDPKVPKYIRSAFFDAPPQGRPVHKDKMPDGEKVVIAELRTVRVRRW